MVDSAVKQDRILILGGSSEVEYLSTYGHRSRITQHSQPCRPPTSEAKIDGYKCFTKKTIELKGIGSLECYLHEDKNVDDAVKFVLEIMESEDLKTIDDLRNFINQMDLALV